MKRRGFLFAMLMLTLGAEQSAAQQSGSAAWPLQIDHVAYAERLIERTRRERPDIAKRTDELYKRLPGIIDQLANEAGTKSPWPDMEMGSPQLAGAMDLWIGDKASHIDTEIRFAAGRLKTVQRAMHPIRALIEERERKQRVIRDVIVLIGALLAEENRSSEDEEPQIDKNKADKMEPSASNRPRLDMPQTSFRDTAMTGE